MTAPRRTASIFSCQTFRSPFETKRWRAEGSRARSPAGFVFGALQSSKADACQPALATLGASAGYGGEALADLVDQKVTIDQRWVLRRVTRRVCRRWRDGGLRAAVDR